MNRLGTRFLPPDRSAAWWQPRPLEASQRWFSDILSNPTNSISTPRSEQADSVELWPAPVDRRSQPGDQDHDSQQMSSRQAPRCTQHWPAVLVRLHILFILSGYRPRTTSTSNPRSTPVGDEQSADQSQRQRCGRSLYPYLRSADPYFCGEISRGPSLSSLSLYRTQTHYAR